MMNYKELNEKLREAFPGVNIQTLHTTAYEIVVRIEIGNWFQLAYQPYEDLVFVRQVHTKDVHAYEEFDSLPKAIAYIKKNRKHEKEAHTV